MRTSFILFIFAGIFFSCSSRQKITVTDVQLEEIKTEESKEEPPPPAPPGVSADMKNKFTATAPNGMSFNDWLISICKNERPGRNIIAYNFGIFETPAGYSVYLMGSEKYNAKDDDWSTEEAFTPVLRYFELKSNEFGHIPFEVAQVKIEKMIRAFMKTETFKKSFFTKAKAITTGFDDGDLVRLN